jgi:cytosine/adenosine deaminase-related metal-dependent hydrolase
MIIPSQADTCRAELFLEAFRQAEKRDLPFQTHASQTMVEFNEIIRRHGVSPVQWLDKLGVLSRRTILGHCLFTDHHTWSPLRTQEDLPLLAARGVTVAHCPTVFGRTGMTMQTAGRYLRERVSLGIGTDSYPYNMLEEIRHAVIYSRITAGGVFDISTADAFHAATIGGAGALLRDDIGRISQGAKADLVIVDTSHPLMRPVHDPLRNLIFAAAERAVKDVFIDGIQVLEDRHVTSMDYSANHAIEDEAQARMVEQVPSADSAGPSLEQTAPFCFDIR